MELDAIEMAEGHLPAKGVLPECDEDFSPEREKSSRQLLIETLRDAHIDFVELQRRELIAELALREVLSQRRALLNEIRELVSSLPICGADEWDDVLRDGLGDWDEDQLSLRAYTDGTLLEITLDCHRNGPSSGHAVSIHKIPHIS